MEIIKELASDDKAYRSLTLSWFKNSPLEPTIAECSKIGLYTDCYLRPRNYQCSLSFTSYRKSRNQFKSSLQNGKEPYFSRETCSTRFPNRNVLRCPRYHCPALTFLQKKTITLCTRITLTAMQKCLKTPFSTAVFLWKK